MSLFEDTNPRALKELLTDIHNRNTVLPDFQRDFVWEPIATQDLIVSIANNYPAGSLLRVRDTSGMFAAREIQGAPLIGDVRHTFLVLDGQQRLTSLYQAFYGAGHHRFYLRLKYLLDGQDFEDAIFHVRTSTKWAKTHANFEVQARELVLPLSVLKGGAGEFSRWSRGVARIREGEERIELEDSLAEIEEKWIRVIDDYHFPVVTLSDSTTPDALCTIFETLNRTGVKLNVYELLTARFWPQEINLRELWKSALSERTIIKDFEVDPYYILQGIALACRESPSCKRGDVLKLNVSDIRDWWMKVVSGLAEALEILRDDCKVIQPKWLPYQTMLPPLAAILAHSGTMKRAESGARRERIKRWFWCSVFGQTYESAANSRAARDVVEMSAWLQGGAEPETVAGFRFDPRMLRGVTPRQRAVYRGTICLILGNGARDFHTQAVITAKLAVAEGIDDHHIFPAEHLKRLGNIAPRLRDGVVNRTLIDRTTNQSINDDAPSVYFARIRDTPDFPFANVLDSHILPSESDSSLMRDDFDAFLSWRESQLWKRIQAATGASAAADLEDSDSGTGYI